MIYSVKARCIILVTRILKGRIAKYYTSLRLILLTGKVGRDFDFLVEVPELELALLQQGLKDIR